MSERLPGPNPEHGLEAARPGLGGGVADGASTLAARAKQGSLPRPLATPNVPEQGSGRREGNLMATVEAPAEPTSSRRKIAGDIVRYDIGSSVALIEADRHVETVAWTTPKNADESADLLLGLLQRLSETQRVSFLATSSNGCTHRDSTRAGSEQSLKRISGGGDDASLFRLEAEFPGVGDAALAYAQEIPGLRNSTGTMSITASSLRHQVFAEFFELSAGVEILGRFDTFAREAHTLHKSAV